MSDGKDSSKTEGTGVKPEPSTVSTKSEAKASDFVIENGVLVKYNGSADEVVVPSTVTALRDCEWSGEDHIFANYKTLKKVTLPAGLTKIGYGAFRDCVNLTSVNIPEGVKWLEGTFEGCTNLKKIKIPDGVTNMFEAFIGCSNLVEVNIQRELGRWKVHLLIAVT